MIRSSFLSTADSCLSNFHCSHSDHLSSSMPSSPPIHSSPGGSRVLLWCFQVVGSSTVITLYLNPCDWLIQLLASLPKLDILDAVVCNRPVLMLAVPVPLFLHGSHAASARYSSLSSLSFPVIILIPHLSYVVPLYRKACNRPETPLFVPSVLVLLVVALVLA